MFLDIYKKIKYKLFLYGLIVKIIKKIFFNNFKF